MSVAQPQPHLRLLCEHPEDCANRTLTSAQRWALVVLVVLVAGLLAWRPVTTLLVLNAAAILFYLLHIGYKFFLVYRSLYRPALWGATPEELAQLRPADLPTYTILVPLYREAAVVPGLVAGLQALDYPPEKREVLFLVEEDDAETREALEHIALPLGFRAFVVPPGEPRTKPRACDWGLDVATGELLVIYDAEDRPERDQLRQAAWLFAQGPERLACVQARLNYYNPDQNLLTRWFTTEYSTWFDLYLPGLTGLDAPVPLGGTSNHFRTEILRELGGWDPFNVTEDCDLGVRLHKHGYRTLMMDSTTWEEANGRLGSWLRQRSRWVKGYLQTWLVHMRNPGQLWRQLGPRGWFSFQMTVGGSVLCYLLNPIYWALTVAWLLTHHPAITYLFPPVIYGLGLFCLYVGNFLFVYMAVLGCLYRRNYRLVKYALLTPLYWLLMSWGAYRGALQLLTRPSYWEKTEHGFAAPESAESASPGGER
ncbi:MAG TPA: glycosyltransferase [Armatimonadota bacterium]|jgi:cellulose synthase/poly-beta-1,6-N-acetylglucosamine synthase-like glycosyltransferase